MYVRQFGITVLLKLQMPFKSLHIYIYWKENMTYMQKIIQYDTLDVWKDPIILNFDDL